MLVTTKLLTTFYSPLLVTCLYKTGRTFLSNLPYISSTSFFKASFESSTCMLVSLSAPYGSFSKLSSSDKSDSSSSFSCKDLSPWCSLLSETNYLINYENSVALPAAAARPLLLSLAFYSNCFIASGTWGKLNPDKTLHKHLVTTFSCALSYY